MKNQKEEKLKKKKEAVATSVDTDGIGKNEAQEILKKYDRESNVRLWEGLPRSVIRYLLVAFSIYSILLTIAFKWETRMIRASFVGCIVFLVFLVFPRTKKETQRANTIPWYDVAMAILGGFAFFYFVFNCNAIIKNGINISSFEIILGIIGIVITLEACRRSVGIPIVIVASIFILYALTQKSLKLNVYNIFYTTEGVIGTPIRAATTFIVLFVIFGSFLEQTGISNFFIEMANSVAGGAMGGPAKVAVISSALCGMVSGSSVGNTVTTGSVTIPMMKKNGYSGEFAGAVEAAASTGGQIMPPIMGAAAFLMVEYSGYKYSDIAVRAILPALLYFAGIFLAVHLQASKLGLKGIPKELLPKFWKLMIRQGYLILPLVILVYLIMSRTMAMAAIIATLAAIVVSMFRKETRLTIGRFFDALENAARSTLSVGIACAAAGIIACVITTTGIGTKLIALIVSVSGGVSIIAMVLTMVTCIVLGMGVPTTANYVIMATTCAPILIKIGVEPLAAHMFVFYFGIVADITPPVALAAYAASAIANSKPMPTAFNATKLAIAAFIVPYVFALNPALLFINTGPLQVIQIVITAIVGVFGVSLGTQGFLFHKISPLLRIVATVGGLTLLYPGMVSDVIGILLVGGVIVYQRHLKVAV